MEVFISVIIYLSLGFIIAFIYGRKLYRPDNINYPPPIILFMAWPVFLFLTVFGKLFEWLDNFFTGNY